MTNWMLIRPRIPSSRAIAERDVDDPGFHFVGMMFCAG